MKKFVICLVILSAFFSLSALRGGDITGQIPEVGLAKSSFVKISNVAQAGDWSNVVGIAHNVSRHEALAIAEKDPDITFYFYVKGSQLILGSLQGNHRRFQQRDAVFFSGQPAWGSAHQADGYMKQEN